jgi:hypothetical protein
VPFRPDCLTVQPDDLKCSHQVHKDTRQSGSSPLRVEMEGASRLAELLSVAHVT